MGWQTTLATIFEGTNFVFNDNGQFYYSGTPAANNLILSITNIVGYVDPYGNNTIVGTVSYQPISTGYAAAQVDGNGFAIYTAATMTGSFPWTQQALFSYNDSTTPSIILQSSIIPLEVGSVNSYLELFGGGALLFGLTPPVSDSGAYIFVNDGEDASLQSNGGVRGVIPIEDTDSGFASGNATSPALITEAYDLDSELVVGSTYTIKCWYNGTWGLEVMTIYADISGTSTALATVGAAFATGAASGDAVNGWIEIVLYVASATTCRIAVSGTIHDNTINANNSTTATCGIAGTVVTGVAIAGGDTLGIAVKFASSVAAQNISSEFAKFTRGGE
jgi:hypothetical protein